MSKAKSVATTVAWAGLGIGPFVLHRGTGDFAPTWGAGPPPTWTVFGAVLLSILAVWVGLTEILRRRPVRGARRYAALIAGTSLLLTLIVLVPLFLLVHVLAPILALPYAIAGAGLVVRLRTPRSWRMPNDV